MITIQRLTPWKLAEADCWPTTWRCAPAALLIHNEEGFKTQITMFDSISTSERRNDRGDRDCTHTKAEGLVHQLPEQLVIEPSSQRWLFGDDAIRVSLMTGSSRWSYVWNASGWGAVSFEHGGTIDMIGKNGESGSLTLSSLPRRPGDAFEVSFSYKGKKTSNSYFGAGTAKAAGTAQLYLFAECPWSKKEGVGELPFRFGLYIPWFTDYGGTSRKFDPNKVTFADALTTVALVIRSTVKYEKLYTAFTSNRDNVLSDLLLEALRNVRQSSYNGLAYLRDARDLINSLVPAWNAIRHTIKGHPSVREWEKARRGVMKTVFGFERYQNAVKDASSTYLNYRYGLRLFIHDTEQIINVLKNIEDSQTRFDATVKGELWGSLGPVDSVCHIEVFTDSLDNSTKALVNRVRSAGDSHDVGLLLRRFDLLPSRENIWDLIPYSFVVDWFLPLGKTFALLDADHDIEAYNVTEAVWSYKLMTSYTYDAVGYKGSVTHTLYLRRCRSAQYLSDYLSAANLNLGEGINLRNLFSGLALVLQRR